jgi:uncharacterized protein YjbI with pentapeptide repeats
MASVSCSNCGREFRIKGRPFGFSHCDQHTRYRPIPDEGVVTPEDEVEQPMSNDPDERYTMAATAMAINPTTDTPFTLLDAATVMPDKRAEAARILCAALQPRRGRPANSYQAAMVAIRSIRHEWGYEAELPLAKAQLAGTEMFAGADLSGADLSGADLCGADLSDTNLSRATLSRAKAVGVRLRQANLAGAVLEGADLRGANLVGADLSDADLARTDLRGAEFDKGIWGADLTAADLRGADFGEAADLRTSILDQARLDGLYLYGASLGSAREAWMFGINLREARLSGARLAGARMSRAELAGADLTDADLLEAWLDGANLAGADLSGADLTGADLTNAVLDEIRWNAATRWPANVTPPASR